MRGVDIQTKDLPGEVRNCLWQGRLGWIVRLCPVTQNGAGAAADFQDAYSL